MTPEQILRELARIARLLGRWQSQRMAMVACATLLVSTWVFAMSDLVLRFGRGGRLSVWTILLAGLAVSLLTIQRAFTKRRNPNAVAARVEQSFPQLDNHLINYVQFAAMPRKNPLIEAYLNAGVPDFNGIDFRSMQDRRAQRRAGLALITAALLLTAPGIWAGPAWTNALLRIINPFSARPPTTLARIDMVRPGHHAVLTGNPVLLECRAEGRRGQEVFLEIWPADDQRSSIALGAFADTAPQTFTHYIPRVNTEFRYRFRAGDDRSAIYRVQTLAPLGFTRILLTAVPPAYTGYAERQFDLLAENVTLPAGSRLSLQVEANRPPATMQLRSANLAPLTLTGGDHGFSTSLTLDHQTALTLTATDHDGFTAESTLQIRILPDQAPSLRILAPAGRATLGPGARPRITWEAGDDYGLDRIILEAIEPDAAPDSPGQAVTAWETYGQRHYTATWTGAEAPPRGQTAAYRLIAYDNHPHSPNRTVSPPVIFETESAADVVNREKEAVSAGLESLAGMVTLQRRNLQAAEELNLAIHDSRPQQWREIGIRQNEIRRIAGVLLAHPAKPLGSMSETVRLLFHGPMTDVLDTVSRLMTADTTAKALLAERAIMLQTRILRVLTQMESQIEALRQNRDVAGLIALLDALIRDQTRLIADTGKALEQEAATMRPLADRQDRLSDDTLTFIRLCSSEASGLARNNPEFAQTLLMIVNHFESREIAATMLIAADHLESNRFSAALEHQRTALEALIAGMEMLNAWRADSAVEKMELFQEILAATIEAFDKLIELQGEVVDSIRQVNQQDDKSGEAMDHLGGELAELRENMRETLLQLATDLHIFPELPVGNDLVQDVFQVFEDVEQKEGSETGEVQEINIGKNEGKHLELLEAMKDFKERLEDMEQWLPTEPSRFKLEVESYDREEFPNEFPVIPMAAEMEDLIGDLLEKLDQGQDTDDTATNIAEADMEASSAVVEGQVTTYSAKGMSGNEAPDHKEQDGRSNIGRQGMSEGETAAGSGTINEGDDDIIERMTQDPAQSGHVDEMSDDAEAVATGGGKQAGHTEEMGMSGEGPRRDAVAGEPSEHGWEAMLRREAETLYARASLSHIKTGSLDEAIRHLRHAEDAAKHGQPIQQIQEHRRRAAAALRRSLTELGPGIPSETLALEHSHSHLEDQIVGTAEEAPSIYRDLVSEYFKALSNTP